MSPVDRYAYLRHEQTLLPSQCHNFRERAFQVLLYVIAQRLQRRDIQDFRAVAKIAGKRRTNQRINTYKEGGQRLA